MDKFQAEYRKLNHYQKEAVDQIDGPVMVLAGPGTGKTQIIAMRIANILKKTQINPANILCLTFTNSGARAMKERLFEIIGPESYNIDVFTFHAFCSHIIAMFPEKFLIAREINHLDEVNKIRIIEKLLDINDLKFIKPLKSPHYYKKTIIELISKLKQENISPKELLKKIINEEKSLTKTDDLSTAKIIEKQAQCNKNKELVKIYSEYLKITTHDGKYDYDDMILFILNAFNSDEELLQIVQEKYQYILVDEYQDTNNAQNEIADLLINYHDNPNFFVVGDDEQSIYRFQGASMVNILNFNKKYSNAKIIVLKENYRSKQKIIDASRKLISKNTGQIFHLLKIDKSLHAQKQGGEIELNSFNSYTEECLFIVNKIKSFKKRKISLNNIAVIYRNNSDAKEIEEIFSINNIQYKSYYGSNLLMDSEILKLINFLTALNYDEINNNDLILEIMHYPFFDLDLLDIYKVVAFSGNNKLSIFDVISNHLKEIDLKNPKKIKKFLSHLLNSKQAFYNHNFSFALAKIINDIGFVKYLLKNKVSENIRNLEIFYKFAQKQNISNKNLQLEQFLEHIKIMKENGIRLENIEDENYINKVNLLTAHKSKGLEFNIVFIVGLIDGVWGNKKTRKLIKLPEILQQTFDENEEERRLFYVALTRAKNEIHLSYSKINNSEENEVTALPSVFVNELGINKTHTPEIDKNIDKYLKSKFIQKDFLPNKEIKSYIKKLLIDYKLNPTALNNYLNCPYKFFLENILKIPKAKTFSQSYGTGIHVALEQFSRKHQKDLVMPALKDLLIFYNRALENEIISKNDLKKAKSSGEKLLENYYKIIQEKKIAPPYLCELNFSKYNIKYKNVPITGRVDKVELIDKNTQEVRIIDYKTTEPKSVNYILGKTKDKNTDLYYQAMFYKLLFENNATTQYKIKEIAFDFLTETKYKRVILPIEKSDYNEFKKIVTDVYEKICQLVFTSNKKCEQKYPCEYHNLCK